jgi:hypothetical protein
MERREQMNIFQTGGDDPETPRLFLLSTRAGGLGINLVAADTVIFYDQDWVRSHLTNSNAMSISCFALESSNGRTSPGQGASYRPNETCTHFQAG